MGFYAVLDSGMGGSMRNYLLKQQKNSYKANLHCHTTWSDGELTASEVKEAYKKNGYQIVAFTDHRMYSWHRELDDENFLALAAMEVDINDKFSIPGDFSQVKTWHMNVYDRTPWMRSINEENSKGFNEYREFAKTLLPVQDYRDMDEINRYINNMNENGFLVCYNHPYWSLQDVKDYTGLKGVWAMEIYNYGCEHDGLYGYHPQAYDEMLRAGILCKCVATDDNHNSYPFGHPLCDSFGGCIRIQADELSYDAIMEALISGNFYSVTNHPEGSSFGSHDGPEMEEAYIEDGTLFIKTSPVKKIYAMTQGRNCLKAVALKDETITCAAFALKGNEGYIRISIMDENGLRADSNVYCLKEKDYAGGD